MSDDYNPSEDARRCYDVAIEAKRKRGDAHWPEPIDKGLTFDLPMPPSVNKLYANIPGKGRVKLDHYKKWINEASWMLIAERNRTRRHKMMTGKVAVQVDAYKPANKRRDLDNILKAICDLLKSTNTIEDDSQVHEITARWVDEGVPCRVSVRPI